MHQTPRRVVNNYQRTDTWTHTQRLVFNTCSPGDAVSCLFAGVNTVLPRRVQEAAQREGLLYRLYNIEFDQAKAGREGWFLFPRCSPRVCACRFACL